MDVYGQVRRSLRLNPSIVDSIDDLSLANDDTLQKLLGESDVEIDVKAHGINSGNLAFACSQIQHLQ